MGKPEDRTLLPWRCVVCKRCWLNPENGKCEFNGPFDGYVNVHEKKH